MFYETYLFMPKITPDINENLTKKCAPERCFACKLLFGIAVSYCFFWKSNIFYLSIVFLTNKLAAYINKQGSLQGKFYTSWPVWALKKISPKTKKYVFEINQFVSEKEVLWNSSRFHYWSPLQALKSDASLQV